jgi:outer membrane protein TolC
MRCLLFIAIGLTLAGCARFQPKPLSPQQNAALLEDRSLTNEALKEFVETNSHRAFSAWPTTNWDFDTLSWAAFYYHPSLEVARAQWAVARGGETTAAQRPNPTLTVTPGYDTTTKIPSPWFPLTFLDIPIETAGKRKYRKAEAAHKSEAARWNVATVAWQVRSDLRAALIELTVADQRAGLLQREVELQQRVVELLQAQVRAGALAGSEAATFRIALIKARLDLIDAQRQAVEARTRVAEAVGVPLRALEGIKLGFTGLEALELVNQMASAEARRDALQSRPDILEGLAEYAAAESALQLEIAKQYPDVHLQPGYQYDQGDNKWTLGLVVDLPILNQNQGPIAEAEARRVETAARFNALQAKVLADIDRAAESVRLAQRNSLTLRTLVEEQNARLNDVAAQAKVGAVDQLELLHAQVESLTTELAQLDGRLKFQQSVGALEDAVHRPFETPGAVFESTQREAR